jgi:predicted RNA-binding Zn-ribbon protein involved in translation (DUF1610 family)
MCEKIAYKSKTIAKHASTGLSIKGKDSMQVYKCTDCGQFHLTTRGKSKTKQTFWMTRQKYPIKLEDIHYHEHTLPKRERVKAAGTINMASSFKLLSPEMARSLKAAITK